MKIQAMVIVTLFATSLYAGGVARFGVKVVDSETGQAIPGMKVHGGFKNISK